MIYLGADHRGFKLKAEIKKWLDSEKISYEDMGAHEMEPDDDYPVIAKNVALKVAANPEHRGILICGSAAGACVAANKVKGIRAAGVWNVAMARAARNDDDLNILCLSADSQSIEDVKPITQVFLNTAFDPAERHVRRLKQIEDLEIIIPSGDLP